MTVIFAGDSWAIKGFTEQNFHWSDMDPMPGDRRMADHWPWSYRGYYRPGMGNLDLLDHMIKLGIESACPIIWIYTEPGRDYHRITGDSPFAWIESEDIFDIRRDLDRAILTTIRHKLDNPIALVGGLSDIDVDLAHALELTVLHASWQKWIAEQMQSPSFQFGWGASDVGWRAYANGVKPSRAATFAWDEQIKEWCWWQDHGWFCHEHPSPMAHEKFAQYLQPKVQQWIDQQ